MVPIKTLSVHHPHNHPLHPSKPGWKIPPSTGSEYWVIVFIIESVCEAAFKSTLPLQPMFSNAKAKFDFFRENVSLLQNNGPARPDSWVFNRDSKARENR